MSTSDMRAMLLTCTPTVSLVPSPVQHGDQKLKERRGSEQHVKCVWHRALLTWGRDTAAPSGHYS